MTGDVLQDNFGATYNEDVGWRYPDSLTPVPPPVSHLEEIWYTLNHYRDNVYPAFIEMRTQGTAIGYFNSGGLTSGPCETTASIVLLLDTMTESGVFRTP